MFNAPDVDWMEWQAGYVCGAMLMPVSQVRAKAGAFCDEHKLFSPLLEGSAHASGLVAILAKTFAVSGDAARVRLSKLNLLTRKDLGPSLL
jgi:Zn-dependent peptidase ImmA (M78 family)